MKNCPFCGGEAKIKEIPKPFRHGWVGCPECKVYMNWNHSPDGAVRKWDRRTSINTGIFDKEEIHPNCTVQVLTNTVTGEVSVGWWPNE